MYPIVEFNKKNFDEIETFHVLHVIAQIVIYSTEYYNNIG